MEEMVRLNRQAALVTRTMGGVLAEQTIPPRAIQRVLDLACGPGEWVLALADAYPSWLVTGVDISKRMIAYASAQAEASGRKAEFAVMDVTHPLAFADQTFDLVNGRFLLSFLKKEHWPPLLAECYRVLRPGGSVRFTEQESGFSNHPVYQRYMDLWGTAWHAAGHAFAYTRAYIGVTVVLKDLMRTAGFRAPEHRPIALDLSTGEPAHQAMMDNFIQALTLASSFLLSLQVATEEEIEDLAAQMKQLIGKEGFAAYWILQTIWASKP